MTNEAVSDWYYVTTLSNFMRGYDKYARRYSKAAIPESTFPGRFFLLRREELAIGVDKAAKLLAKLDLPGDRLIALKTALPESALRRDHASGIGQYIPRDHIALGGVYNVDYGDNDAIRLVPATTENLVAESYEVIGHTLLPWDRLAPRSVSVLPLALACQAACKFCFSKASVSADFEGRIADWDRVTQVLNAAKEAGAERAVITGGGEPTLLKPDQMTALIGKCAAAFNKVVLITNGHIYGRMEPEKRRAALRDLDRAGLNVLALSRHHHDPAKNRDIMGLDTKVEQVASSLRENAAAFKNLMPRLICVLQKDGIESVEDIGEYLSWAAGQEIGEITFKELYVSTANESAYADTAANQYSAHNQVPLAIVHDFCLKHEWQKIAALPWGAPVYRGNWDGKPMQIAAYTEPSVYWERTNGVARSWNLMSDGTVLASLEDLTSKVIPR